MRVQTGRVEVPGVGGRSRTATFLVMTQCCCTKEAGTNPTLGQLGTKIKENNMHITMGGIPEAQQQ